MEVDKTTVDLEALEDGTLGRIVVPAGAEKVRVGEVLAMLHRPGERRPPPPCSCDRGPDHTAQSNGQLAEAADRVS